MQSVKGMSLGTMGVLLTVVNAAVPSRSYAGDPLGVSGVLRPFHAQWPSAQLSVDALGLNSDGELMVAQDLHLEEEAALPGYLNFLRVSSHGDMTLFRLSDKTVESGYTQPIPVRAPLGTELMLVLYSSQPLDALFRGSSTSRELGSDVASANAFIREVRASQSRGIDIASRQVEYSVVAQPGETQYTTRSVIHIVAESSELRLAKNGVARVPSSVEFELNSDRLTSNDMLNLDAFGQALVSELRGRRIVLEGYSDDGGTNEYNKSLSLRRAEAVKQYLTTSFGIPFGQVTAAGKGKSQPMAPSRTEEDRARNRRVDIIFFAKNSP